MPPSEIKIPMISLFGKCSRNNTDSMAAAKSGSVATNSVEAATVVNCNDGTQTAKWAARSAAAKRARAQPRGDFTNAAAASFQKKGNNNIVANPTRAADANNSGAPASLKSGDAQPIANINDARASFGGTGARSAAADTAAVVSQRSKNAGAVLARAPAAGDSARVPIPKFHIDNNIRKAAGPPSELYHSAEWFDAICSRVLSRAWHCVGDGGGLGAKGAARPVSLLPGALNESLLLVNDGAAVRCLPNICTHRGHAVVEGAGCYESLVCKYHGRTFSLDGHFKQMPEFKNVEGFPAPSDDLIQIPCERFGPLLFVNLDSAYAFDALLTMVKRRVEFMPVAEFKLDANAQKTYEFEANWALYVDNYLEGFHIPFIHKKLASTMEWNHYKTTLYDYCNLQVAPAAPGEPAFELPAGHPDSGSRIAAYYFWLFPGTMLNFYPWGLSVNIIEPLSASRTRVRFASYIWKEELRGAGAGGDLQLVEMEDEAAVCSIQKNLKSRFAPRSRYSPSQEIGVHHFHRLLAKFLQQP